VSNRPVIVALRLPRQHQGTTAQSLDLFAVLPGVIAEEPRHPPMIVGALLVITGQPLSVTGRTLRFSSQLCARRRNLDADHAGKESAIECSTGRSARNAPRTVAIEFATELGSIG
jgi:hypothetical protein